MILKKFLENRILKNISVLVSGSVLGQMSTLLASPILTRLFTPAEFGVFGVLASIVGILVVVSSLRYELALPLQKYEVMADNLLAVCVLFLFIFVFLVAVIVGVFAVELPGWLNADPLSGAIWLIPTGVLIAGLFQIFTYSYLREKRFNQLATARFFQGMGSAVAQIIFGVLSLGALGLISGLMTGQALGLYFLLRNSFSNIRVRIRRVTLRRILVLSTKYKRFPKYASLAGLANSGGTLLPVIILASMFDSQTAGLYLLAHRTLLAPLTIVGGAVGQVYLSHIGVTKDQSNLREFTVSTFKYSLRLSLPLFVIFYWLSPLVFEVVFGESWARSGIYAQWMVPWLLAQFCVSPISNVTSILEKQFGLMVSQLVFLVVRSSAIVYGGTQFGIDGAIICYVLASAVLYLGHLIWIMSLVQASFAKLAKIVVSEGLISLPLMALGLFSSIYGLI